MENSVLTKELFEVLEAVAEKHANNLFDAYLRGYRDGQDTKEEANVSTGFTVTTSPAVVPTEEVTIPAPEAEVKMVEPVKTSRHRKYTKDGTKITLVDESNKKYTFKSKTDAGYFLGRSCSYISSCEVDHRPVKDTKGNLYEVVY